MAIAGRAAIIVANRRDASTAKQVDPSFLVDDFAPPTVRKMA